MRNKFIILQGIIEGLNLGQRFFTGYVEEHAHTMMDNGVEAYKVLGYAETVEEAQDKLYRGRPMNEAPHITTETVLYPMKDVASQKDWGSLETIVSLDGLVMGRVVLLRGRKSDIEAYQRGEITMAELHTAWGFKTSTKG